MTSEQIKTILYWLCLVISPIILVSIELFHPAGFTKDPGMFEYLSIAEPGGHMHHALGYFGPEWWFTLHMIQTPVVGLVAIGLVLLIWNVRREEGALVFILSRLGMVASFLVMIYFTALDSIGGIGLGRTLDIVNQMNASGNLSPDELKKIADVLNTTWVDPWVGGVGSVISHTASWAIFFAGLFPALVLFLTKRVAWPPLVLMVIFGWEVQVSHASYHGPVGFGLLLIASLWIWFTAREKVLN